MGSRRAEREQLLIARQPPEAELDAEHEREGHRHDQEVRGERRRHARQVRERDGAAEDHLVELQELEDDEELDDGEKPDPQRHRDFAEHQPVQERHRGAL